MLRRKRWTRLRSATGLPSSRSTTRTSKVVTIRDWPKPDVRGAEAAWEIYLETFGAFELWPIGEVDSVDVGDDKALLHHGMALSERGIAAGIDVDYWNLATIRQGKVIRVQWFAERSEALEAAGLRE